MAASSSFKSVSLTFASLIFIQSVAWGVLSLLAILCIHGCITFDSKNLAGLPEEFTIYVYTLYLGPGDLNVNHRVFPNEYFIYIFWIYFLFSIFLAFSSATHIILLAQDAKRNKVNFSTIIILILVFASCLYDVIAAIIFGVDYVRLKELPDTPLPLQHEYLLSVPIFMATLAAKGYVLWLANFILAITISVLLSRNRKTHLEPDPHIFSRTNSVYDAYGNAGYPRRGLSPEKQMEQVHPCEMTCSPYAIPVDSNIGDYRDNNALWAGMPKRYKRDHQLHSLEPCDATPARPGRTEPMQQQYAVPFSTYGQIGEPEPDYSPSPVRRMGRNSAYPIGDNHFYATR